MKVLSMAGGALAWCLISAPAMADTAAQPPMNNFNYAFYNCADGGAFQISYDSETPKSATMTTNDNNRQYVLNRTDAQGGVAFTGEGAKFWTDGKAVQVEGTSKPLKDCKMRGN